ncbi:shikimate kinase [Pseudoxanthomonas wuyuanensis]|uniref:Shikimate kinase n=1 Tax=Pseudoxanthomonas wuyuanensis TaxID=1073196 RepID=A0A286DCL5_9GAMM|nr:shikimate kinase [Pseudoxanthomonas wuyuanensis]KAF1719286.1 shikimate kinase [Pseudoxanthomonas wuyuanensis]SOD56405.1 shikimate kinase [Pseudoxanthomonas wuyuanensis]
MNPSPNLVLIGPTGAGKTSIGKRVAERFSLEFIDVDHFIVERAGASIPALFEHIGEAGFRQHETAALNELLAQSGKLISTGAGAVLDAGNRQRMRQAGFVVYLRVSVEAQLKRLGRCSNRPLLQQPNREQVLREMAAVREPLYAEIADLTVDTDGLPPPEATARLIHLLAQRWQRTESFA